MYANIALPVPLDKTFDYLIPSHLLEKIQIGCRVRVKFGRRMATGFCVGLTEATDVPLQKLREISSVVDEDPVMDSHMLEFSKWWAQYYCCSWGEALTAMIPSEVGRVVKSKQVFVELVRKEGIDEEITNLEEKSLAQSKILRFLRDLPESIPREQIRRKLHISLSPFESLRKKGWIAFTHQTRNNNPIENLPQEDRKDVSLTGDQQVVVDEILKSLRKKIFQVFLIFGITGSGKTEIYMRAIEETIQQGREVIVLVPEISLTPQTLIRFRRRFQKLAVLHSELSPAQRARQWEEIQKGNIQVIVGARSALFAPTRNLGLIVVDEEHEPSFKQQTAPRYHARDLAVKRAHMCKATVILGSATPSLESFYNASVKKYELCHLPKRIGKAKLPKFVLINMRDEFHEQKRFVLISRHLIQETKRCLAQGNQAIFFINRRGFSTTILCPACGYQVMCPHCEIALTYHKKIDRILCHYCGYETTSPDRCPICQFEGIRFRGIGIQRIESAMQKIFPEARILRMDSDTMTTRKRYEEAFLKFSGGQIDILLGTQMIAKGLDFPRVTLVGCFGSRYGTTAS